jgi:hypothetical protein
MMMLMLTSDTGVRARVLKTAAGSESPELAAQRERAAQPTGQTVAWRRVQSLEELLTADWSVFTT